MGYAVRIDGPYGWRLVDSPDDCLSFEEYRTEQPAPYVNPNASVDAQIEALESYQTPRLVRSAAMGSTDKIVSATSPLNGLTPLEALEYIEVHIELLRKQRV